MSEISKLNEIFLNADRDNKNIKEKNNAGRQEKKIKKSGFVGGILYYIFVFCIAIIIAAFLWMAANDALSLNKGNFEATILLPEDKFTTETVNEFNPDNTSVTKSYTTIDSDYVAKKLKEAGLINYEWLFKLYCNISNATRKLEPGEYVLKSTYDYRALIQHMQQDRTSIGVVNVTIPEGFTMHQIFKRFEEEGVSTYDDLMYAAANSKFKYSFLDEEKIGDPTRLEGFLFPDTYEFYKGMEASSAINKMLQTFYYKITPDMQKQADNLNLSFYNVLKVASIVEREAQYDEDRALVASVVYNRLNSGWQIGMDSTILYLYPDHEGEPTAEMLAEDTPYNSRLHRGLPPTPICNPGLASISAALNPEPSTYYYFMSDETGHMHFFSSQAEFESYARDINENQY